MYGETSDSEENCEDEEVNTGNTDDESPIQSLRFCKKSTGNHTIVLASAQSSKSELQATESHAMPKSVSAQHETTGQASASFHPSTSAQASSSSQQETPKSTRVSSSQQNSPTSRRWQNDYGTYINLINDSLDEDEDEQLYTAIIASIEDQT